MRTYWRQRNDLVQSAGRYIQRMQKALTQMNIQLANVLSDVSGMTGQAIIKAILAGERDPHKLAEFRDARVKASEVEIARSLEGNWQEDLLFVLQQEQDGYEFLPKADGRVRSTNRAVSRRQRRPECRSQSAGRNAKGTAQEEERQ
jgi:transposase